MGSPEVAGFVVLVVGVDDVPVEEPPGDGDAPPLVEDEDAGGSTTVAVVAVPAVEDVAIEPAEDDFAGAPQAAVKRPATARCTPSWRGPLRRSSENRDMGKSFQMLPQPDRPAASLSSPIGRSGRALEAGRRRSRFDGPR